MISALAILGLLLFVAAQGGIIFLTALLFVHLLKASHWLAKCTAMAVSYIGWVAFTIGGYAALGGDGGLMDGFGMVLVQCFTALISTFIYLVIWTAASRSAVG